MAKGNSVWILFLILVCVGVVSGCKDLKGIWIDSQAQRATDNNQFDKAVSLYQQLIDMEPGNYSNYWNLASVYLKKKDVKMVEKQLVKIRSLKEDEVADDLEKALKKLKDELKEGK